MHRRLFLRLMIPFALVVLAACVACVETTPAPLAPLPTSCGCPTDGAEFECTADHLCLYIGTDGAKRRGPARRR